MFFFLIAATLRVQSARWMWPSSPVPPCCCRVWCVAGLLVATRLFFLSAGVGISAVYVRLSGLQDCSCRLVMVPASFSWTCGHWVSCGPCIVSWHLRCWNSIHTYCRHALQLLFLKPVVLFSCICSRCSCTWLTKQCMLGMARILCKSPRNTSIALPTRSTMSDGEFSQVGGIPMWILLQLKREDIFDDVLY